MSERESLPPGCVSLDALNPRDGSIRQLFLRESKIESTARRGMGAARELAYLVPDVLLHPTAIFRGVREEGERQWVCYVGFPSDAYNYRTGERIRPRPGQVFLVFADDYGILYNWRWEQADKDALHLPERHGSRFEERLL